MASFEEKAKEIAGKKLIKFVETKYENHQHKEVCLSFLSKSPCITVNIIESMPHINWDFGLLSENPNLTLEFIDNYTRTTEDIDKWNWLSLSKNPTITLEFVRERPHLPWMIPGLSINRSIRPEDMMNTPQINWRWYSVSKNPNLTLEFVDQYPNLEWDWWYISKHRDLTIPFILKYSTKDWCWENISANPAFTLEDYWQNPHFPWVLPAFISNPNITTDFIGRMYDLSRWVHMEHICLNPSIPISFIKEIINDLKRKGSHFAVRNFIDAYTRLVPLRNPPLSVLNDFPHLRLDYWSWGFLSRSSGITSKDIENNSQYPWDWNSVSLNRNLTFDLLHKHMDKKWLVTQLSKNDFQYERERETARLRHVHQIIRWRYAWRRENNMGM